MNGNPTTTPTTSPLYLLYDRSDPANPRIVIACGRWSLPVGHTETTEMSAATLAVEWMASLPRDSHAWVDDAHNAELAGWEPLQHTLAGS